MGLGAGLLFFYAVKKDWFRDVEDAKYQVFWSDLQEMIDQPQDRQEKKNGSKPEKK